MKRVAIVIPAYNEENTLASVVNGINRLKIDGFELISIVVNDCSKDQTAFVARNLKCELLNLPVNLGIGGAVQTGLKYALSNNFDYAMQVDGDGQHPACEIPKLIIEIDTKGFDVVIGSRFIIKAGFQSSFLRRLGIIFFSKLIRTLCGIKISDTTSGFRIMNRKSLEVVSAYYPDEYPEPESLILFHKKALIIREVPVSMIERQGGQSSINAFSSIYYLFKVSLAILYTFIRV